jgi:hypothetical protein
LPALLFCPAVLPPVLSHPPTPPPLLLQVALEFHQMREQYPFFFTSQLGNKFW